MNQKTSKRTVKRMRVKKRIAKKIYGTPEKPRLVVFRGLRTISAQLIDDSTRKTLTTVTSQSSALKEAIGKAEGKVGAAKVVGQSIAEKAKALKITNVVFDRNGYVYHGRVKAVAEGAREGGLQF